MCIGISTTRETYDFEVEKPSDNDMAKYVKYAQLYGSTNSRKVNCHVILNYNLLL